VRAEGRNPKAEGRPKSEGRKVRVCFAVKEEAAGFQRTMGRREDVRTLLVGMGKRNAERAIRAALSEDRPSLVLTCGFAGGLRPDLAAGAVVFAAGPETGLEPALRAAGATPAEFLCVDRVAATAAEKRALRQSSGADAVEMESQSICAVCRERQIPCATVRVILDTADDDLPLNFNEVMTADQKMSYGKLAVALAKSPARIAGLLRLQQQSKAAADKLGQVLIGVLASLRTAC
jgi:adenosylhomocysteine nucleosidase